MRTIAIINQKGGCGKTTTAINLAGVLAAAQKRVLLVDLDPQSHCAAGLAIPEQRIEVNIGDALLADDTAAIDWTRLLWRVSRNLDLAPSSVRLAGVEAARGGLAGRDDAERRLASVLARVADQYDVCLLDCPPSIGLLTFNALVAATEVLIPVETGFFALQGATKQMQTIQAMGKKLGVQPPFRLLPTIHDESSPMSRDVLDELRRRAAGKVTPVVIRHDSKLREAVTFGQPIIEYAPDSNGAHDYRELGRWVLSQPAPKAAPVRIGEQAGPVTIKPGAADKLLATPVTAEPTTSLPTVGDLAGSTGYGGTTLVLERPSARVAEMAAKLGAAEQTSRRASHEVMAAGLFGVRPTAQGVLFVQPAAVGKSIHIAGEFNGWSPNSHPLRLNPSLDVFEATVNLPPGRYPYRLVVDGRWITDPFNPVAEANPFGELNSILVVPGTPEAPVASAPAALAAR